MRKKENPDEVRGCTAIRNVSLALFNGGHGAGL
jgi:hypothetical protein